MKKFLLTAALAVVANFTSQGQAVIGTLNAQHLDIRTDNSYRARWTSDGFFLFNTANPGFNGSATLSTSKSAGAIAGDVVLQKAQGEKNLHLAITHGGRITSGPAEYNSTTYNNGDFAYIELYDTLIGNMVIQTYASGHGGTIGTPKDLVINEEHGPYEDGAKVLIGTSTPLDHDKVQVEGGIYTKGFAAKIESFTSSSYNAANDDYTIIADVSGGNRTVHLPSDAGTGNNGVNDGKILNIRRYDPAPGTSYTLTINPSGSNTIDEEDGSGNLVIGSGTAYQTVQIQKKGTHWYIIGSH